MAKDVTQLERVGGHPALDFANTVSWRGLAREIDYLRHYDSLVGWSRTEGLLTSREAARLVRAAAKSPRQAAAALARALVLRHTVFQIGSAMVRGRRPSATSLARLHAARVAALSHARLVPAQGNAWVASWRASAAHLDRPWWPVADAFASLLERPEPHPLGMCPGCSWLFLDASRNRSRRWCSSTDCGNRARGQRFRDRHAPTARGTVGGFG